MTATVRQCQEISKRKRAVKREVPSAEANGSSGAQAGGQASALQKVTGYCTIANSLSATPAQVGQGRPRPPHIHTHNPQMKT